MIISNAVPFYSKWWYFVNKFLVDDTWKKFVEDKGLIDSYPGFIARSYAQISKAKRDDWQSKKPLSNSLEIFFFLHVRWSLWEKKVVLSKNKRVRWFSAVQTFQSRSIVQRSTIDPFRRSSVQRTRNDISLVRDEWSGYYCNFAPAVFSITRNAPISPSRRYHRKQFQRQESLPVNEGCFINNQLSAANPFEQSRPELLLLLLLLLSILANFVRCLRNDRGEQLRLFNGEDWKWEGVVFGRGGVP